MPEDEAKFSAKHVPRHYAVNAVLDAHGMFDLIQSLRRFVDEFDAPDVTYELLNALEEAFVGELPQRIDLSLLPDGDDDEGDEEEALDT